MRRPLLLLLKAAISILLLYMSLRSVDLAALAERLSRLDIGWIAIALALLNAQVVLLAIRWRSIVTECGPRLAFAAALRITFIAAFFSQVLPSTIGGDAARIWLLARRGGGWASATYSVLLDRIAGICALALIVIACLPWTLNLVHNSIARSFLLLIGGGAVAGACVFMAIGVLRWRLFDQWALTRHLVKVSRVGWRLCASRRSIISIGAISLSVHLLTIVVAWCFVQAVSASASFALLLFLVPPVILIATVPVSIAGWGVREGGMIIAFAYAGLAQSDGLIVSVLLGLTAFAIGTIGGIAWIMGDARLPAAPPNSGASSFADRA